MAAIPENARPVLEIVRRDVERPPELPVLASLATHPGLEHGKGLLRDERPRLRWVEAPFAFCPLGLHPKARHPSPGQLPMFPVPGATELAVDAFGRWWDHEQDPAAAVEAVWGKGSR